MPVHAATLAPGLPVLTMAQYAAVAMKVNVHQCLLKQPTQSCGLCSQAVRQLAFVSPHERLELRLVHTRYMSYFKRLWR